MEGFNKAHGALLTRACHADGVFAYALASAASVAVGKSAEARLLIGFGRFSWSAGMKHGLSQHLLFDVRRCHHGEHYVAVCSAACK